MMRTFSALTLVMLLSACGGGGGSSSSSTPATEPDPSNPEPTSTSLDIVDAIPSFGAANVDPYLNDFHFAHLAQSDLNITLDSDCAGFTGITLRHKLVDLAEPDFNELAVHHANCEMTENTRYTIEANGTRGNGDRFDATLELNTGTAGTTGLIIKDQLSLTRATVDDMFRDYVEGGLVNEIDLPGGVRSLIIDLVIDISEANWDNLTDPESLYAVSAQRVTYLSRTANGSPSTALSGLVAFPLLDGTSDFVPRDRVIVLTHATGSTPSELNSADAWFILATMFASRGYLVVAPDNYGRGNTDENPETYLMANRTAYNAFDLLKQTLTDESYDAVYDGNEVSIIGYSQGGHTAMALWQLIAMTGSPLAEVREVYAGGAPHNLYQTVRGVLQHIDGSCNDEVWCRYVDTETTVPFATDRILPGFLTYADSGLSLSDVVIEDSLAPDFVTGFLSADPQYDRLKMLLQLNSFTGLTNPEVFSEAGTLIHLYHSEYDRLVPIESTQDLAAMLSPHTNLVLHENRCNSNGYELIFNLTEKVGALHTLCGISVLDDAMGDLR